MANVYESDSYNIVEVLKTPVVDYASIADLSDDYLTGAKPHNIYLVKIQRLPEASYPSITEIIIPYASVSVDLSKDAFISAAVPIINATLSSYDNSFNGTDYSPTTTTDFTQAFS